LKVITLAKQLLTVWHSETIYRSWCGHSYY